MPACVDLQKLPVTTTNIYHVQGALSQLPPGQPPPPASLHPCIPAALQPCSPAAQAWNCASWGDLVEGLPAPKCCTAGKGGLRNVGARQEGASHTQTFFTGVQNMASGRNVKVLSVEQRLS